MTSVVVTGGAGYIGAATCLELRRDGFEVRALDSLIHGQTHVVELLRAAGVAVREGDVRDHGARAAAFAGADAVVHLAAIVGDPACAEDPGLAASVNVDGARGVLEDVLAHGVRRFVFASTCSNYGRVADTSTPVAEDAPLRPVSLYAEQKVGFERLLETVPTATLAWTRLRFATIYGLAPRMRFDLTVNEFTRELCSGRHLEVFGERFWRPYVHVEDAARAIGAALQAAEEVVAGETFNVGRTSENYRKLDLVELIREQVLTGTVAYVHRDEDPRDYRVAFAKAHDVLGIRPRMSVADGVREIAAAVGSGTFADPWHRRHRNSG